MPDTPTIEILYKNHRGEIAWRKVEPHTLYYGQSSWHSDGSHWILFARDVEKNLDRSFLLSDILCIGRNNISQLVAYLLSRNIQSTILGTNSPDLTNDERCELTGE